MTQPLLVFISHTAEDRTLAEVLHVFVRAALGDEGVRVFNASHGSIEHGQDWRETIFDRLRESSVVLVLATPESVSRPWVNFEAGAGVVAGKTVIPCCAGG